MKRRCRGGLASREQAAVGAARATLLFVHGLGESGLCFEGLFRDRRFEALDRIALDLPGYGASPWDDQPRSLQSCAEVVAGSLPSFAPPIVLIGHSMGGVIGQLLLELPGPHRGLVSGFVDVEGNLSPADCTFSGPAAAQERDAFLAAGYDRLLERLYREGADDRALRSYYVSCSLCDPRAYHQHSCELVEASRREDLGNRLGALPMPRVYLHGHPRGTGARSLELLRRAGVESVAIDDAGHWPFLDQPARFALELERFLARCRT